MPAASASAACAVVRIVWLIARVAAACCSTAAAMEFVTLSISPLMRLISWMLATARPVEP